ncbi:MAG: hypothetical protein RLZZ524_615, partial [Pseudomonadota bacterium]
IAGGLMLGSGAWVEFRRIHNQVQLIERNADHIARSGTPEARAVAAAFSPSLIASTPVASAPHPERKTVLIDAGALLMGDWPGLASALQRSYRQSYGYDGRNSAITAVRVQPELLVVELQNHYAAPNLSFPQGAPTPPGTPQPSLPSALPDPRSLFVRLHYSLTRLPTEPMRPRPADQRIGHFTTVVQDHSDDLARNAKVRHVNRWRLEKKDPNAALSEPVRPITYWIDRNVPLKYRSVISDGILEWNTAFERIGLRNAIEVRIQPDDASFDTLDTGVASVRWMLSAQPGLAGIGPTHVDPRSGEILDADIAFEGNSLRFQRLLRRQILAEGGQTDWSAVLQIGAADAARPAASGPLAPAASLRAALAEPGLRCEAADQGAAQLGYALELLAADAATGPGGEGGVVGDIDEAAAEALVRSYLKNLVMHEVGHTLGLRHNFRASQVVDPARLADPVWSRDNPLTGSVMDYVSANLPSPGEPAPAAFQQQLGPYDFWAIEYAYRPIPEADERAELARIAARSAEPELAFGTDEDAALGLDPQVLQFDLGSDPLAHVAKRLAIARDLIARAERQTLAEGDEYARLRRRVSYALLDIGGATGIALRQIGGVLTLRDRAGSGRDPLQPLPAARQRAALDLIAREVLSTRGLSVSASLQRRLAPDFFDRAENLGRSPVVTEFQPEQVLGGLQRSVLNQLMSDALAQRLLDQQGKARTPDEALTLAELLERVRAEVWSELARPASGRIEPLRRDLQRDHATRLAGALLRPAAGQRAELRSLLRQQARTLHTSLRRSLQAPGWDALARQHLQDLHTELGEALDARVVRSVNGG